jgi:DNA-formamidopyrimidine glycosylase
MPEAAEVKLTAEYLNSKMSGKFLTNIHMCSGQYQFKNCQGLEEFEAHLPVIVNEVGCKGKLIYITCFNETKVFYILHSLRMTGRWQETKDKYCRWWVDLEDSNGNKQTIYFRNPRCLATLYFTTSEEIFEEMINKLGPDILSSEFNLKIWKKLVKKHSGKNITSYLMNQNIISGCGNYIKAEALYEAKISPLRKVGSLTDKESEKLFNALRTIPRMSYNYKGLSIRDFADHNGTKGEYEFFLKIYGKKEAKKTKTTDGRTTYWDPEVQM